MAVCGKENGDLNLMDSQLAIDCDHFCKEKSSHDINCHSNRV